MTPPITRDKTADKFVSDTLARCQGAPKFEETRGGGWDFTVKHTASACDKILNAYRSSKRVMLFRGPNKDKKRTNMFGRYQITTALGALTLIDKKKQPLFYQTSADQPCILFLDFDLVYDKNTNPDAKIKETTAVLMTGVSECVGRVLTKSINIDEKAFDVSPLYDMCLKDDLVVRGDPVQRKMSIHAYFPGIAFETPTQWVAFLKLMDADWVTNNACRPPWDTAVRGRSQAFRCPYALKSWTDCNDPLFPHVILAGQWIPDNSDKIAAIEARSTIPLVLPPVVICAHHLPHDPEPDFKHMDTDADPDPSVSGIDDLAYIKNILPGIQRQRRVMTGASYSLIPRHDAISSIDPIPGRTRMWRVNMTDDCYCPHECGSHRTDKDKDKVTLTFDLCTYRWCVMCRVCGDKHETQWRSTYDAPNSVSSAKMIHQLINPALVGGHVGKLYAQHVMHQVKTSGSRRGTTYTFIDPSTGVWSSHTYALNFPTFIREWIQSFIETHLSYLDSIEDEERKAINNVKRSLTSTKAGRDEVLYGMYPVLYDPDFCSTMNPFPYLVPYSNDSGQGMVYDARIDQSRRIAPEDRITSLCKFNLQAATDENIAAAVGFMNEISCEHLTPNATPLADYLTLLAGSFISGYVFDRHFYLFHGSGQNGKSAFVKILQQLLVGQTGSQPGYYCSLPNNFFGAMANQATGAESASPVATNAKDTTVAVITELPTTTLDVDKLKKWSGQDSVEARALYEGASSFVPRCKILLLMNKQPKYPTDAAFWDRAHVIPFNTRYTLKPTKPTHLMLNEEKANDLKTKHINGFGAIFCKALHKIYLTGPPLFDKYLPDGTPERGLPNPLPPPEIVVRTTASHHIRADYVARFIKENTTAGDSFSRVSKDDMFETYTAWVERNKYTSAKIDADDFNVRVVDNICNQEDEDSGFWVGIHLNKGDAPLLFVGQKRPRDDSKIESDLPEGTQTFCVKCNKDVLRRKVDSRCNECASYLYGTQPSSVTFHLSSH